MPKTIGAYTGDHFKFNLFITLQDQAVVPLCYPQIRKMPAFTEDHGLVINSERLEQFSVK